MYVSFFICRFLVIVTFTDTSPVLLLEEEGECTSVAYYY